jgi:hypothetical protein
MCPRWSSGRRGQRISGAEAAGAGGTPRSTPGGCTTSASTLSATSTATSASSSSAARLSPCTSASRTSTRESSVPPPPPFSLYALTKVSILIHGTADALLLMGFFAGVCENCGDYVGPSWNRTYPLQDSAVPCCRLY